MSLYDDNKPKMFVHFFEKPGTPGVQTANVLDEKLNISNNFWCVKIIQTAPYVDLNGQPQKMVNTIYGHVGKKLSLDEYLTNQKNYDHGHPSLELALIDFKERGSTEFVLLPIDLVPGRNGKPRVWQIGYDYSCYFAETCEEALDKINKMVETYRALNTPEQVKSEGYQMKKVL